MKYPSWNKKPYGECDLGRLRSLESFVGTCLPKDFVSWLKNINGGDPKYKCIEISKDLGISEISNIYGFNALSQTNSGDLNNHGAFCWAFGSCGVRFPALSGDFLLPHQAVIWEKSP